jgi:hypothetical protein
MITASIDHTAAQSFNAQAQARVAAAGKSKKQSLI